MQRDSKGRFIKKSTCNTLCRDAKGRFVKKATCKKDTGCKKSVLRDAKGRFVKKTTCKKDTGCKELTGCRKTRDAKGRLVKSPDTCEKLMWSGGGVDGSDKNLKKLLTDVFGAQMKEDFEKDPGFPYPVQEALDSVSCDLKSLYDDIVRGCEPTKKAEKRLRKDMDDFDSVMKDMANLLRDLGVDVKMTIKVIE